MDLIADLEALRSQEFSNDYAFHEAVTGVYRQLHDTHTYALRHVMVLRGCSILSTVHPRRVRTAALVAVMNDCVRIPSDQRAPQRALPRPAMTLFGS